jgi:antitoxin component HigA of HigAB toxin-antitoxin module
MFENFLRTLNTCGINGRPEMIESKATTVFKNGIPNTFVDLCAVHLPRPIHDKAGHEKALAIIHALAGLNLNEDQADYFEALAIIVKDYETKNLGSLDKATPLEVLRYLVEENNISTRELGRLLGKDESLGAKILSGQRRITVEHAKILGGHFKVNATVFIEF